MKYIKGKKYRIYQIWGIIGLVVILVLIKNLSADGVPFKAVINTPKLLLSNSEAIRYDGDSLFDYYICQTKDKHNAINKLMDAYHYNYIDQMGSGYIVSKDLDDSATYTITEQSCTKHFKLLKIPK